MAVHSMLINKPPDAGTLSSRHPVHQVTWFDEREKPQIFSSFL